MNANLTKIIKLFIIVLWAITLVLLVVGLVFLFASFEDNELFTRIALSLAAMMSVISFGFTIYAMIKNKQFSKNKVDEKQNLKFKLNLINKQNEDLYKDTKDLAAFHNIEMLDIEYVPYDNLELANHLNEELTIENSRIRSEIEARK